MLENYKIKVNNEAESKEAQELFFDLGFIFRTGLGVKHLDCKFLYARNGIIEVGYDSDNFECSANKETTLDQLRNLLAEKKNESGLISGADALRALADGQLVQWMTGDEFQDVTDEWQIREFSHPSFKFRLKPRTITLNGIEISSNIKASPDSNSILFDSQEDFFKVIEMLKGLKNANN